MHAARASTSCRLLAASGSPCGDCMYGTPRRDFPTSKLNVVIPEQRDRASNRSRTEPRRSIGKCCGRAGEYSCVIEHVSDAEFGGTRADESLKEPERPAAQHEENDHSPLQPWPRPLIPARMPFARRNS